jgi:putative lipoic acid-binding regulatory protein
MQEQPPESLLTFPTVFPVKIMGRDTPEFHAVVDEILARHVAPLKELPVTRQASREGKFVSITVTINAQSREQLDALYRELSAHDLVLMAL